MFQSWVKITKLLLFNKNIVLQNNIIDYSKHLL